MDRALQDKIEVFLTVWHENGRAVFERTCPNLDYDTYYHKRALPKSKWVYLVKGTGIVFMLDPQTETLYLCKAWGVPNLKKRVGTLDEVTQQYREPLVKHLEYA